LGTLRNLPETEIGRSNIWLVKLLIIFGASAGISGRAHSNTLGETQRVRDPTRYLNAELWRRHCGQSRR
jgi:hypothetical protein